ncbi:MAG: hypothetical protein RL660_1765 [Bacteroidota bacterium]|jgi:ComF family protein
MLKRALQNIASESLQMLYPQFCVGCNGHVHRNEHLLCTTCFSELATAGQYVNNNEVEKLFWGRFSFEFAYGLLYFHKGNIAAKLLHALKYDDNTDVGNMLGNMLAQALAPKLQSKLSTVLLPVPLHKNKQSARGYNQSEIIATALGESLGLTVDTTSVRRVKHTLTQTRKSRFARLENTSSAFRVIDTEALNNKHVVLLDDVCTSGATIEACALAVLEKCNCSISIVSAAIAVN